MRKRVIWLLVAVLSFFMAEAVQASDLSDGRALLFNNGAPTVSGVLAANEKFKSAVQADAENQEAHLFYAVTRVLSSLAQQGEGAELLTMRDFLEAWGLTWNGNESLVGGGSPFDPPLDYGSNPPATIPSGAALQDYLAGPFVDLLNDALADLDTVSAPFTVTLTSEETGDLPVVIDYGDVLVVKSSLYTLKALVFSLNAWDLDFSLRDMIILGNEGLLQIQRDLLDSHEHLLRLKADGANSMGLGKVSLVAAIDAFRDAFNNISQQGGDQTYHLFAFGSQEDLDKAQHDLGQLTEIENSLAENRIAELTPDYPRIDLNRFFGNDGKDPLDIRLYLPPFNEENRILPKPETVPTPILGGLFPDLLTPQDFINTFGDSLLATVPEAPSIVKVKAGNGQATITFSRPDSDGGSSITGYTVTSDPGVFTASGPGSPLTVTGLTNGTSYTFTVTATNEVGVGPASWPSDPVVPRVPTYTVSVPGSNPVIAISAGVYHTAALRKDGTVVAWGDDSAEQSTVPQGLIDVISISAGYVHTVALKKDGTVEAWGDHSGDGDDYGQVMVPEGLNSVKAVAAGGYHTVVLKNDGTVVAWGSDDYGQSTVPEGLTGVKAIAAGAFHTLALKSDGTVVGWGDDDNGQTDIPEGLTGVVAIAAGIFNSAALRADGTVVVWGENWFGQNEVPEGLGNVKAIAVLGLHVVALQNDGTVVAWGADWSGQATVPDDLTDVSSISAGYEHTVALRKDGTVVAWGDNGYGQADVPDIDFSHITAIAAGVYHTVALKKDGTVIAWGMDWDGQTDAPDGLSNVTAIAAGRYHTTALKNDGTVVTWGYDEYGQTDVPEGLTDITFIAAGDYHTVALKSDGTVVAWGLDWFGETDVPDGLTDVSTIAAGDAYTAALKTDGTVVVWGEGWGGGRPDTPDGLSDITAIAAGGAHIVALKKDGTVVAWGYDGEGQTDVPEGLTNVIAIAAGGAHTVALRSNGTVVAWGYDEYGQADVPEGLTEVIAIAAGGDHTVALKKDGTVVMWGDNEYGQSPLPYSLVNVTIDHGAITCPSPITEGGSSVCAITPDPGYHLASFVVNEVDKLASVANNSFTIPNIHASQIVVGSFAAGVPPDAPTIGSATAGNSQASVSFTAPGNNGGSAITGYTVTSHPGNKTASGAASPIVVSGLTNGTVYTFTVVANNVAGDSAASSASNSVTPRTVPDAPTIGTATAGNTQATVSFTAPGSNGGSAITGYTVTSNPGNITVSGAASPIVVSGLTNGTAYTFTVLATNAAGDSVASSASNSVTPYTLPGAPAIGKATKGPGQASVSFTAPANNGSAITSYTVTSSPGGKTGTGTASPVIVSGLTSGKKYTFTVKATNAAGTGASSAPSNSVTPGNPVVPGKPTGVTATKGNARATVAFTPPANNGGSAITSYTVTATPGGKTAKGKASPITVTGLKNGTAYKFTVKATNKVGTGAASAASNKVIPARK